MRTFINIYRVVMQKYRTTKFYYVFILQQRSLVDNREQIT